jgi:hypothetical protein
METRYPAGKQREKCHLRLIGRKAKGRGDPLLRPLGWLARTHLAGARPPAVVWSVGRVASTRAGERRSSGGHTNTRRFFCRTEAEEKKKERGRGDDKWRRKSEQVGGWLVRRRGQSRWVGGSFAAVSSTHHGRRVGVQALLYSAGSANAHAFHMIPYYITHVPFLYGTCSLHSRCG